LKTQEIFSFQRQRGEILKVYKTEGNALAKLFSKSHSTEAGGA